MDRVRLPSRILQSLFLHPPPPPQPTIWTVQKVEAQSGRTVLDSNTKPVVCSNRVQCRKSVVCQLEKNPAIYARLSARERQLQHAYSTRGSLSRSLARCAQQTALACATIVSSSRSRATHHSHTRYINVLAGWLCATFGSSAFRTQGNKQTNKQTNISRGGTDGVLFCGLISLFWAGERTLGCFFFILRFLFPVLFVFLDF